MLQKLMIILGFAAVLSAVYFCCMRSTPRRGVMRVIERVFMGIILCYLCGVLLTPLGVEVGQGPLPAVSAGYLGLPGVALTVLARLLP